MDALSKKEQVDEWLKCADDPIHFIKTYCKVHHPDPKVGTILMDDVMYPKQEEFIRTIHENRFTITSKTRQCGASTVLGLYALWMALFNENIEICIISRKDGEAKEFKRRYIDVPYDNLPPFLRSAKQKGMKFKESVHTRTFDTGSLIKCEAGPNAGRGGTYSFIILDEAGFIPHIEDVWSSIYPTLNVGRGKGVVNSTSSAMGTWYANQWHGSIRGENDFVPVEINWYDVPHYANHPGWLEEQERNLTPHQKFRREVLREFIVEGETFIDEKFIHAIEPKDPMRSDFLLNEDVVDIRDSLDLPIDGFDNERNYIKGLWIWQEPIRKHKYLIGVDVSDGRGADRSAIHVIDIDAGEQVAEFNGKPDTTNLAKIAYKLGTYYNSALIAVEYNNMGAVVFNELDKHMEYQNLYWRPKNLPGWMTTASSRDAMLTSLSNAVTHSEIKINSRRLKEEITNFVVINGKAQAADGTTDDLVMSFAISVHLMDEYAISTQIYDIQHEEILFEDIEEDMTLEEMKRTLEENIGMDINLSDYQQYKWMY